MSSQWVTEISVWQPIQSLDFVTIVIAFDHLWERTISKVIESIYIWFACNRCQNTGQYNSAYVTLDVWMCLCAFVWNFDASRNLNFAKVNFNWKLHLVIIHVANRKLVFFTFPVKNSLSFSILLENQWKNVDTFIRIDSFVFIFCLCLHRACSFWGNEFLSKSTEKKLKIYSDSFVVCKQ